MTLLQQWPIVSFIIFAPLLGLIVLLCIPKDRNRQLQAVAFAASLVPLLLSLWLYGGYSVHPDSSLYAEQTDWISFELGQNAEADGENGAVLRFDYAVGVDGLSLSLTAAASLVTLLAVLASVYIKKRRKAYYGWLLLLECGMLGVFLARDLLLLFVFLQAVLVAMAFLLGIWGEKGKARAAKHWLIMNGISSALLLVAILMLIHAAGTVASGAERVYSGSYDWMRGLSNPQWQTANADSAAYPAVQMTEAFKWILFLLLTASFGIRMAVFPVHIWLVKAGMEAPAPIAMLLSGGIIPIGAYGMVRLNLSLFPVQANQFSTVLLILGLINLVYGALLACRQTSIHAVLAYSMVSQSGIVLLGLASGNQPGVTGAMFHAVSGSIVISLLWLLAGAIQERTGSLDYTELGGLARPMPFVGGAFLAGSLALLGLPGMSGFVGGLYVGIGVYEAMPVLAVIACMGLVPTALYAIRNAARVMYGPVPEQLRLSRDARLIEAVPIIVLLAFAVLLGCFPSVLTDTLLSGLTDWYGSLFGTGVVG